MAAVETGSESALVLAAIRRARTVCPTWGPGWTVSVLAAPDREVRTALASLEQVLALAAELQGMGFVPVVNDTGGEFGFLRDTTRVPSLLDHRSTTQ